MTNQLFKRAARTLLGGVVGGTCGGLVGCAHRLLMGGSIINGFTEGAFAGSISGMIAANTKSDGAGLLGVLAASAATGVFSATVGDTSVAPTISGGGALSALLATRRYVNPLWI